MRNTCKYLIKQIPNDKEKYQPENADQPEKNEAASKNFHSLVGNQTEKQHIN